MNPLIPSETKVAWIGTGTMGGPMAGNLAKAGYRVTVWNRTMSSAGLEFAASQGCSVARKIDDALQGSRVVCSCVTDGPALRSILFAPGRDLKNLLESPAILVDLSTIGPLEAQRVAGGLAKVGARFVDAPMTGGDIGARDGKLTFMVGAAEEDLETVRPLLATMGKKIVHAGAVGSGQSLKLVNQLLCGVNLLAVVEAFQVAEMLGMDRSQVVEACGAGAAGSWQLVNLGPKIITGDLRPGFKAAHLLKDLRFLRDVLGKASPPIHLPGFELALAAFDRVTQMEQGESGTQAVWMAYPAASP